MPRKLLQAILLINIILLWSCANSPLDESDDNQKYIGTWNVSDQAARINYQVTIIANPSNSSEILLNNFADLGSTAIGLVIGNSVVIDNQSLGSAYSVSGSGSYINVDKLEFKFDLNDGIDIQSRIALFTK
jgi:hypothetical protein